MRSDPLLYLSKELDALKQQGDQTLEPGDIVVTEEQARRLSQPQPDSKGQAAKQPARPATPAGAPARPIPAPAPIIAEEKPETGEAAKRPVRSIGPTFLPAR